MYLGFNIDICSRILHVMLQTALTINNLHQSQKQAKERIRRCEVFFAEKRSPIVAACMTMNGGEFFFSQQFFFKWQKT